MNCDQFQENLDPFLDEEIEEALLGQFQAHAPSCDVCADVLSRKKDLRQALKSMPVPPPADGFLDTVIEQTLVRTHRNEAWFWSSAGAGGAVAAGVIAWLMLALPADLPRDADQALLDTVTITLNIEKTIKVSFESVRELQAATLSVQLPPGVEVVGYDGRDSISWTTTIKPGTNILELPIIVRFGNGGLIVARLEHEGKKKSFEFDVAVT
jgi:anti-sigma factor RsiW